MRYIFLLNTLYVLLTHIYRTYVALNRDIRLIVPHSFITYILLYQRYIYTFILRLSVIYRIFLINSCKARYFYRKFVIRIFEKYSHFPQIYFARTFGFRRILLCILHTIVHYTFVVLWVFIVLCFTPVLPSNHCCRRTIHLRYIHTFILSSSNIRLSFIYQCYKHHSFVIRPLLVRRMFILHPSSINQSFIVSFSSYIQGLFS